MTWKPFVTPLVAALVVLGACEGGDEPPVVDAAAEPNDSIEAEAPTPGVLAPINRSGVRGTAEITRDGDELEVRVEAEGLEPGAEYTAHVHEGRCADGGPVRLTLGSVVATEQGRGSVQREVETEGEQLVADAELFVQVHGPDDQALACANLERLESGS